MPEQEQKLIEDAKKDSAAFAVLYEKYFDQIYRYTARRVNDVDTAHDLVSQTFFDALTHIKSFEWRGVSFVAWLYKIAHNNVLKWYREQSKMTTVELEEGRNTIDKTVDQVRDLKRRETKDEIAEILDKLEYEEREIIRLKFYEEVSNIEIAEIMGTNANHVGVKVFRALRKVKQLIANSKTN
ncbi:RNA polymerase sigma factor [Pseudomonadota bacterium]